MCLTNSIENFFPQIKAKLEQNCVVVWRFPIELSQSRFGGRLSPSNACTLIAVSLAELIHRNNIKIAHNVRTLLTSHRTSIGRLENVKIQNHELALNLCPLLLSTYLEAIVSGNESHETALNIRRKNTSCDEVDPYFTVPDAIVAVNNPFREIDFCSIAGPISSQLPSYLRCVIHHPHLKHEERIFIIMIAFQKSVLFIYERSFRTLTLIDTHLHGSSHGGLVASCNMTDVRSFSKWVSFNIFQETLYFDEQNLFQAEFELSVLNFCGDFKSSDCFFPQLPRWPPHNFNIFPELDSSSESSSSDSISDKEYSRTVHRSYSITQTSTKRYLDRTRTSNSSSELSEKRLRF